MRGREVFQVTPERPLLQNPLYRIFSILLLYYCVVYVLIFKQPGFQNLSVYFFGVYGII